MRPKPTARFSGAVSSHRRLPGVENGDDVVGDLPGGVGTSDVGETLGHQPPQGSVTRQFGQRAGQRVVEPANHVTLVEHPRRAGRGQQSGIAR